MHSHSLIICLMGRQTPASYIISWRVHRKWGKKGYFRILANYSDANFFKRYPGYAIGNLTSRAFWKCGSFCCYNFLNRSYGCWKSTESEILAMLAKKRVVQKKTRLQFFVSGSAIESASNIPIFDTLIQYGSLKRKIVAGLFILTGPLHRFFVLKFDSTSTSHNLAFFLKKK